MENRTAASVGFVFAGLMLASGLLPWPGRLRFVAIGLGVIGLVAFALRRYGRVDRDRGSMLAGGTGGLLVLLALYGLFQPVITGGSAVLQGPAVAAAAGCGAAVMAYADRNGIQRRELGRQALATLTGALLGGGGLFAIVLWASVIAGIMGGPDALTPPVQTALSAVALGLGTASVAAFYLVVSDRGRGFIDLDRPDLRHLLYVGGGVVVIVGLNLGISAAFERLGVDAASHSVVRAAEANPEILLVLIPLSYLVIGPGEELLYRNVIQKRLYESFSRRGAVVVASAIFAGAHIFAYSSPDSGPLATVSTLLVIFALSLVLGTAYERTDNMLVPALIHGTFNAIAFAVTYAQLS